MNRRTLLLVVIGAVALLTRLLHLESQLWLDEISIVMTGIRRPVSLILTEWPDQSSHVLIELLAHWSSALFGESAFALRLPAALFGVAGVLAAYSLTERATGYRLALLVAGLLSVSYHHVFYSQNVRGYTALIFFFLVSTRLFLGWVNLRHIPRREGLLYAACVVLATYSMPFGAFIPAGQLIVAFVLVARDRAAYPFWNFFAIVAAAGFATALLYAPFLGEMFSFAESNTTEESAGPRLGMWLLVEILEGLAAAFGGPWILGGAACVGLAGLVSLRKHALLLAALVVPVALEFVVFVGFGFGLHPRYFAIALVPMILVGAEGLASLAERILARVPMPPSWRSAAVSVGLALAVLVSALPLVRYYQLPKQDFLGAVRELEAQAPADRLAVGVQAASEGFKFYGVEHARANTMADLLDLQATGRPVWIMTTLERLVEVEDAELLGYIHANYREIAIFPGTIADGEVRLYTR